MVKYYIEISTLCNIRENDNSYVDENDQIFSMKSWLRKVNFISIISIL